MKNNSHPKPFWIILTFLLTLSGSVFVGFLASISISKSYWGYYFNPPGLPKQVEQWSKIRSITPVSSIKRNDGSRIFKINTSNSCIKEIQSGSVNRETGCYREQCDTEYCNYNRILLSVNEKGKLPKKTPYISLDKLNNLYNYLESTELLYKGEPGYNGELISDSASHDLYSISDGKSLKGIVVEAEDKNQQSLLFIAVKGGQVSNDHYPYYEFLFEFPKNNSTPQLIANNRFFFDIAGFEGILEWQYIWIFFIVIGLIFSIPITFLLIRMKARYISVNSEQSTVSSEQGAGSSQQ
ncbi:MAG: hypothetical protein ACFB2X_10080 [Rivularia sp. (in: cyanobacteria)]